MAEDEMRAAAWPDPFAGLGPAPGDPEPAGAASRPVGSADLVRPADTRSRAQRCIAKARRAFGEADLGVALRQIKLAIRLVPDDPVAVRIYKGLLAGLERETPRCALLIVSCEKYRTRATALARRLRTVPDTACRIVVGREASVPEDPIFLRVEAPDDYESLPLKVRDALIFAFEAYGSGTPVCKIDDDVRIGSLRRFAGGLYELLAGGGDYSGVPVDSLHHDRTWHFKKCRDPRVNVSIYGKRFREPFADGPFYMLSPRALEAFVLANLRYPDEIAGELYEDKFVGDTLCQEGIALSALDPRSLALTIRH
jgi:hypothetical protein